MRLVLMVLSLVLLFFRAQADSCPAFAGTYQCQNWRYFWEDEIKPKSATLQVQQNGARVVFELGSYIGRWFLTGKEERSYGGQGADLHKAVCSRGGQIEIEEASGVTGGHEVHRTISLDVDSEDDRKIVTAKIETYVLIGSRVLGDTMERWKCTSIPSVIIQ